jgi:hypothetical protein
MDSKTKAKIGSLVITTAFVVTGWKYGGNEHRFVGVVIGAAAGSLVSYAVFGKESFE